MIALLKLIAIVAFICGVYGVVMGLVESYDMFVAGSRHWSENKTIAKLEKLVAILMLVFSFGFIYVGSKGLWIILTKP